MEDDHEVDGEQKGGENIEGSEKEVVEDDQEVDGGQRGRENFEVSDKEGVEDKGVDMEVREGNQDEEVRIHIEEEESKSEDNAEIDQRQKVSEDTAETTLAMVVYSSPPSNDEAPLEALNSDGSPVEASKNQPRAEDVRGKVKGKAFGKTRKKLDMSPKISTPQKTRILPSRAAKAGTRNEEKKKQEEDKARKQQEEKEKKERKQIEKKEKYFWKSITSNAVVRSMTPLMEWYKNER